MISGLVPTMVITLSLATQHLAGSGCPGDPGRGSRTPRRARSSRCVPTFSMLCVMPGRDVHDLEVRPRHAMLGDLVAQDRPEADHRVAFEHAELLDLEVVVVVAPGDARAASATRTSGRNAATSAAPPGCRERRCAARAGRRGPSGGRYERVGAEQPAREGVGRVGDLERLAHGAKAPNPFGQFAEADGEGGPDRRRASRPAAGPRRWVMNCATTSSTWTSSTTRCGSEIVIGRSRAMLWQKVATTEL